MCGDPRMYTGLSCAPFQSMIENPQKSLAEEGKETFDGSFGKEHAWHESFLFLLLPSYEERYALSSFTSFILSKEPANPS